MALSHLSYVNPIAGTSEHFSKTIICFYVLNILFSCSFSLRCISDYIGQIGHRESKVLVDKDLTMTNSQRSTWDRTSHIGHRNLKKTCFQPQKKFLSQFFAAGRSDALLLDAKSTKKISCDAKTKMFLCFVGNRLPAAPDRWQCKKREKISLRGARMKYFSICGPVAARSGRSWTLGRH